MPDALAIAYAYLNRRERTVAEVRARLERAECLEEDTAAAITELIDLGVLDDARYARVFIEDKRMLESWGSERIRRGLGERGVDRDVVLAAFAAVDGRLDTGLDSVTGGGVGAANQSAGDSPGAYGVTASELDRAVELLERRYSAPAREQRERERAFGMLVRKGYDSDVAGDAIRVWSRAE